MTSEHLKGQSSDIASGGYWLSGTMEENRLSLNSSWNLLMVFEVGDLVCARNDRELYCGCGIVLDIDADSFKFIKIYWFNNASVEWEQIYHLEAYCENRKSNLL